MSKHMDVFLIMPFVAVLILISIVMQLIIAFIRTKRSLNTFKGSIRVENNKLVLPEEAVVDQGVIHIKGYHQHAGRSGGSYNVEFKVMNPKTTSTKTLDLSELCNNSFYVYIEPKGSMLIEAPGFIIKSGRFKDVVTLCLEQKQIPERTVELTAGDPDEYAKGMVKLGAHGLDVRLTWVFQALTHKKIVYEEKLGVHRVEDEYSYKPKARGARLELCIQTPDYRKCIPLAVSNEVNKPIGGTLAWRVKEKLIILHRGFLGSVTYGLFKQAIDTGIKTLFAGYKPRYITAKLILDIPMRRDVMNEIEL